MVRDMIQHHMHICTNYIYYLKQIQTLNTAPIRAMQTELDHRASMRTPSPPGLTEEQKAMLDELEEEERA